MVTSLMPVKLEDIAVSKNQKQILGPINFKLDGSGCSIVMGPNGAGKTTFLRTMHGLIRPSKGKVDWSVPAKEAYKKQSFVFQTPRIMRRSVMENLIYPLLVRGKNKKLAMKEGEYWLEKTGLSKLIHQPAMKLSGGEKQKLSVARALITQPEVLFLDEPSASLDGASTLSVENLLKEALDNKTRIIMATHDLGQARRLGDQILFMYKGQIHEVATGDVFFANPKTSEAQRFLNGEIVL